MARAVFDAHRLDDRETLQAIAEIHSGSGELVDPHTAIGIAAAHAGQSDGSVPTVALATAHPAKFPDAVERATGIRPTLPPTLADLHGRPERVEVLPNDLRAVKDFVRGRQRLRGAA